MTGQVTKTSEHAVAMGSFNDIFIGQWLGEDVVSPDRAADRQLSLTPRRSP